MLECASPLFLFPGGQRDQLSATHLSHARPLEHMLVTASSSISVPTCLPEAAPQYTINCNNYVLQHSHGNHMLQPSCVQKPGWTC